MIVVWNKVHRLLCCLVFLLLIQPVWADADPLSGMTLEQRIGQMFIVNLYGPQLTEVGRDFLTRVQPGGVVLIGDNIGTAQALTRLINSYQQTSIDADGLPLFVAVDQEGGPISHLRDGFTVFPTPALLTASGQSELARRVGAAMAAELRAVGVNLNLAPVADLETNPDNPIITRRSFGSDPTRVSPIMAAYIEGLQSAGVLATAKHFPGHGETDSDSHTTLPILDLTRERLDAVELAPFRAAIDAGVEVIMAAHIWYPALEPQENLPASLSSNIITRLLRDELGYDGLVMTDALDMDAIDTSYSYPDAALKAIQAGVDLLIAAHIGLDSQEAAVRAIADAVRDGRISEARIDESARRILDAKARYNLLDWTPLDPAAVAKRLPLDANAALVEEMFRAGVTRVFDHAGLLPLTEASDALIIYPATRPTIVQECGAYTPDLNWLGVSESPTDEEIAWAADSAARAGTVITFTQNADSRQQALVQALPAERTVVVALWSPYDVLLFPRIAAYVVTYSPLRPAVPAACALLFGAVEGGMMAVNIDFTT
jgi:beta-N-acetylhexosaminidase